LRQGIIHEVSYPVPGIKTLSADDGNQRAFLKWEEAAFSDAVSMGNLRKHSNKSWYVYSIIKLDAYSVVSLNKRRGILAERRRFNGDKVNSIANTDGLARIEKRRHRERRQMHHSTAFRNRKIERKSGSV